MGLAHSLRNLTDRIGGFADDVSYDDEEAYHRERRYEERRRARLEDVPGDDFDDIYEDEPVMARQPSHTTARPLALVTAPRVAFGLLAPRTFEEAQQIADRLRAEVPVIVDLQGCEEQLATRLIDFCSGLTYALEGSLQLVDERILLLAPHHAELSGEATVGLRPKGFFNQL
jgi:cell division inhibitor SepF